METALKNLQTYPRSVFSVEGLYLQVERLEQFGMQSADFLGKNVQAILGADTWLNIVSRCYRHKIHYEDHLMNLPIGRTLLKGRYELSDGHIVGHILELKPICEDLVKPETIFYNWLDKQNLEGVSILPFLEKRELALLFQSASNTRPDILKTISKSSQFISNIAAHRFTLRDAVDRILVFRDGRKVYPASEEASPIMEQCDMLAEKEVLSCRQTIDPWDSVFIRNNPGYLNLHVGDCITAISTEPGFKYLGAWAGFHERQFNKPIETMVGSNYDVIDIDLARLLHDSIQRLLKNGKDTYTYTHRWKGYPWEMQKHGTIIDVGGGRREIFYKTTYPDEVKEMQTTRFLTLMDMEK